MIKQPTLVRDRVIYEVARMLFILNSNIAPLEMKEDDVLNALKGDGREALLLDITTIMLTHFGHKQDTESRFSQTKRALANAAPAKLRGGNTFDNGQDRKKAQGVIDES